LKKRVFLFLASLNKKCMKISLFKSKNLKFDIPHFEFSIRESDLSHKKSLTVKEIHLEYRWQ